MPSFGPISRRRLIQVLRDLDWSGPYQGTGPHPEYMIKGDRTLTLPNVHRGDIDRDLLARLLRQAGISRDEWERV